MCQKIINVLAIASAAVSVAVVGAGGYVYLNKEAIIEGVKEKAIEAVTGSLGCGIPTGSNDLPSLGASTSGGFGAGGPATTLNDK